MEFLSDPAFILLLILLLVTGSILYFFVSAVKQVKSTSCALISLFYLNQLVSREFSSSNGKRFDIIMKYKYKQQFDSKPLEMAFADYIASHYVDYASVYNDIIADNKLYENYERFYAEAKIQVGKSWNKAFLLHRSHYNQIEEYLFRKWRLPAPSCTFRVSKSYTSPKKRNHYHQQADFGSDYFIRVSDRVYELMKRRKEARKRRYRLGIQTRYLVLRRDGFACQICGRTMAEGAQLQVDHIKPVAKGGTNELSNLRTLCRECNLGKSDFYNPDGLN